MQLLTLSVLALCLVAGTLASVPTLTKSVCGDKVTLTCSVGSHTDIEPPYTFEMSSGTGAGSPLADNPTRGTVVSGATLTIAADKLNEAANHGTYVCKAKLSSVTSQKSGPSTERVSVAASEEDTCPTLTKKVCDGKVTLTCAGSSSSIGHPYEFQMDGSALATDPAKGLEVTDNPGKLTITKEKSDDAANHGSYTCKGTNSGDLSDASVQETVGSSETDHADCPPTLTKKVCDGKVTLTCAVGSLTNIQQPYKFFLTSAEMETEETKGRTVNKDTGILTITKEKLDETDNQGDYTCKAKKTDQTDSAESTSVNVAATETESDVGDCSSAPRVIATGLAMSLCLMAASFL